MGEHEARASDLLDRLADCGLAGGLTEDDLLGGTPREPLRALCASLADRLWALHQAAAQADPGAAQAALLALRRAAASERAAGGGALDSALAAAAAAAAGEAPPAVASGRLDSLEQLAALLQAGTLLAATAARRAEPGPSGTPAAAAAQEADPEADPEALRASAALRALGAAAGVGAAERRGSSAAALAAALRGRCAELLAALPAGFFEPLLPWGSLDERQLATLGEADTALRGEYKLRRRMLTERAVVTLRSFLHSSRLERSGTKEQAQAIVDAAAASAEMGADPRVKAEDVFTATLGDMLSITQRATCGDTRAGASVKSVVIGSVPDRGGRPEGRARAASMPEWAPRRVSEGGTNKKQRGGGGGGGRGHHRGRGGKSGAS